MQELYIYMYCAYADMQVLHRVKVSVSLTKYLLEHCGTTCTMYQMTSLEMPIILFTSEAHHDEQGDGS